MNLANKRRIVSDLLGIGKDRIWFDEDRAEDIKSAITRDDLRVLLREGAIRVKQKVGTSRGRAKKIAKQKSKGRRKGPGSRKGVKTSRLPRKEIWKVKIRGFRNFFLELRKKGVINQKTYHNLRVKAKSGIFRSKRHVKLYLEEKGAFIKKK